MVMFKAHGVLEHVTGKFGGQFFRQMPCSNQIVIPPRKPRRDPTEGQRKVRACFHKCFWFYVHDLTDFEVLLWHNYNDTHFGRNKKGSKVSWGAPQWFDHFNIPRCMNDLPFLRVPPLD